MARTGRWVAAEVDRFRKVECRREKEHVVDRLPSSKRRHVIGLQVISRKKFRSSSGQGGGKWENLRKDCRGEGGCHRWGKLHRRRLGLGGWSRGHKSASFSQHQLHMGFFALACGSGEAIARDREGPLKAR